MTSMPARTVRGRLALFACTAFLVAACASVPTTPVTSVDQLAGRWQGTITLGFNGPQHLYYLTIRPDGAMEAQWGPNWQWGKVTISGGAATFEMSDHTSGPLTYEDGPAGRHITMKPLFSEWYVQVRPAR
jgi:hypothetical protein